MIDTLLSGQLAAAALVTAANFALIALGLNLVYGTMRLLNVAHGDIVMLGGYGGFWLFTLWGVPPLISLLLMGAAAGLLGIVAYRGLFRGMLLTGRPVARLESNSLLMFFGLSIVLQNSVALIFTATPRGYQYLGQIVTLGHVALTANRLAAALVAVAVIAAVFLFLRLHPWGLAVRGLIEQREAAAVVGVDIDGVQMASFAVGFASAAIAGTLISMSGEITPFMGFPFTIAAFVVVILGGLGSFGGSIVAALVLAVIETYGVALTSATWNSILLYGVFVAVLIFRPQGLARRGK
ncbi:MAG: branched-chain amino acid ABC transporter permease, partial [Stellaceae bacterium]